MTGTRPERLIPAHAGKTPRVSAFIFMGWAHPRSRGENDALSGASSSWKGSSPLTRGKLARAERRRGGERLIPAHAGKTESRGDLDACLGAHPRSRGENSRCYYARVPYSRLIPAHAGKTSYAATIVACFAAHPRSRGENARGSWRGRRWGGSSPLTRGKLKVIPDVGVVVGLIPAHAGKTGPSPGNDAGNPAHPRSRGENFSMDG